VLGIVRGMVYSIAAGDVDSAAGLVEKLWLPTLWQGRVTTLQRWFGWLDQHGGFEGHPMVALAASILSAATGRPAEAERWADLADHLLHEDEGGPQDPATWAWGVLLRAVLCRRGAAQMLADADEAGRRFAAHSMALPVIPLLQGLARVLSGDRGGSTYFEDAVDIGQKGGMPEVLAIAHCERALLAMAGSHWDRAEAFDAQAREVLSAAGAEDSFATPLLCAVRARAALHRGDVPAARRELVSAQRLRPLLTYALPYLAVQARIELTHAHVALGDLAGARTLMGEIDELLTRCPGLGTLVHEAEALRDQLAKQGGSITPGASSLTDAELRLLPLLTTYLPFGEIAAELFLSLHTIKTQARSIYRKLGASTRSQAVSRARELGLLDG
jgi:LuxR family transcriptional regulator, maltose regulon positive regulatory protein